MSKFVSEYAFKSSFKYWFAHWCAFQMTALNLGCWKFKYLFHDIEKPWLMLLWRKDYQRVQYWHRCHAKHHIKYMMETGKDCDWDAMIIDWECSRFTKAKAQLNARQTLKKELDYLEKHPLHRHLKKRIYDNMDARMHSLGL